jgi:hypothetical protein
VRGFGLVWRARPGVRDRLGWATVPETAYEGQTQGDPGTTYYLRARDGGVVELTGAGSAWRLFGVGQ